MLALALDTSSATIVVGLLEVGSAGLQVLAERTVVAPRGHGELLAGLIAECAPDPTRLGAVVVGIGPGPFTGLRVGIVTAAAVADAGQVPVYGVCSLDAVDLTALGSDDVIVIADARRREVYWARYRGSSRVDGPSVGAPGSVPVGLARVVGARIYPEVWPKPVEGPEHPDARSLGLRAQARLLDAAPTEVLAPLYLRRPDAVEPGRPKPVS